MEYADAKIIIPPTDQDIQAFLQDLDGQSASYTRHFAQSEDFFIRFKDPLRVPPLPIHHDFQSFRPGRDYLKSLGQVVKSLSALLPEILEGTTYFFDPRDHLRPSFYRFYKAAEQIYMYQMKIDLTFHPSRHRVVQSGSNDRSPEYETQSLYLEADFIPVSRIETGPDNTRLVWVSQSVSDTWIGETGRGYFVQGIWLDRELSRFFSRLFTPGDKSLYPYFPFTCKYRAVCHSVAALSSDGRKRFLPVLHHGRAFLKEHMKEIEDALRKNEFSESMPEFLRLQKALPRQWNAAFDSLNIRRYLNEQEMREYEIYEA